MKALTQRQHQVLEFIQTSRQRLGFSPSHRDIARHFGFKSVRAATDHICALVRKGALAHHPRQARSLHATANQEPHRSTAEVPIYGVIPAGVPEDRRQESQGCVAVDLETLGIRPSARTFALQVRGDSMIGCHIVEGDFVIFEHGKTPRPGDVVAALIDNESTLKTFVVEKGKPHLRAENPRYPKLIPAQELVIQGVMVGLMRKARA